MGILTGKTAVITGGSSGVGRATACLFAEEGAQVTILARNPHRLESAVKAMKERGLEIDSISCDVGNEEQVKSAVEKILEKSKKIDFLINNAGVGYSGPVEGVTSEIYDRMMDTNMRGVFLMTKYILPLMKSRKDGYIVNISSGAGLNGIKNLAVYCAGKFAVRGFSEATALEAKPFDVRVSVLMPGSINSDFHHNMGADYDETARQNMMQPEDIAHTLLHIITQPKRYWVFEVVTRAFLRGR